MLNKPTVTGAEKPQVVALSEQLQALVEEAVHKNIHAVTAQKGAELQRAIHVEFERMISQLREAENNIQERITEICGPKSDLKDVIANTRRLEDLNVSIRTRNGLERMGISMIGELSAYSKDDLRPHIGEIGLVDLEEALKPLGLKLPEQGKRPIEKSLQKRISNINFSVRARKICIRLGVETIGGLVKYSADELGEMQNCGVRTINEIREKLVREHPDLRLKGD